MKMISENMPFHNFGHNHGNTLLLGSIRHRRYGDIPDITSQTPDEPLLKSSLYVDMRPGCKPEDLLNDYILSMQLYIQGDTSHPLVSRFGWGKSPRHARAS